MLRSRDWRKTLKRLLDWVRYVMIFSLCFRFFVGLELKMDHIVRDTIGWDVSVFPRAGWLRGELFDTSFFIIPER